MADEKDNSLYMAAGSKIFNQMERLTTKKEKVADQMEEAERDRLIDKAQSVANIKKIAVTQGGEPLTTKNIASVIGQVATTVTNRINQMAVTTTKQFLPIDSQIKQVNDLLTSNYEGDIDKGFELIDRLQTRLGVDLGKYSKEIGDSVQKLYDMNRQRKEDKAEAERIRIEKTQELTQERDILRERGINTYVNEKQGKLEIKSKKEERIELKRIQEEERKLDAEKKELNKELKQLKKQDTIDKEDQEKILLKQENLSEKEKLLQRDKEKANLKPGERTSGMLDQTVGAAFRQIKDFGKEIKQLGGDLFKGLGKLAGAAGRATLGFFKLIFSLLPFILIATMIGVALYALYRAIKSVVDFVSEKIDKVKSFFGMGQKDPAKDPASTKNVAKENKAINEKIIGEDGKPVNTTMAPAGNTMSPADNTISPSIEAPDEVADEFERNTGMRLTQRVPGRKVKRDASFIEPASYKQENLNKMSVENQVLSESKSTNNTVIAPNVSNSNVNSSNTQTISMEPTNFDRSFINLNSVPV